MPRRDKSRTAARKRSNVVPMEQKMDPRALAKQHVVERGDSVPPPTKAARKPKAG